MRLLAAFAVVLFTLVSSITESATERPEASAQLKEEGLAIYGTVMRPGTREPVVAAQVVIGGPDRTFLETVQHERETIVSTDGEGRFRLAGLSAGRYEVGAVYPETGGFTGSNEVRVGPGEIPPDLELWLPRRSRISGRVTGPDGEPIPRAAVSALRPGWQGRPTLVHLPGAGEGRTDEAGRYVVDVPPGEYYLIVGGRPESFVQHFYPGVPDSSRAVPLRVAGGDLTGIDVSISDPELYTLRFDFVVPPIPGLPEAPPEYLTGNGSFAFDLLIAPREPGSFAGPPGMLTFTARLDRIDSDTFQVRPSLPPGKYGLYLQHSNALYTALRNEFDVDWVRDRVGGIAVGRFSVDREGADELGVVDLGTLTPSPKVSVPGRVTVSSSAAGKVDLSTLRMTAHPDDYPSPTSTAEPDTDGSFVLASLLPARYSFSIDLDSLPTRWYVVSGTSGGLDVLRDGLDVGGQVNPIEVLIADDGAEVGGTARNDDGRLIPGARIILIPPFQRRGGGLRFQTALADERGNFRLRRVAPGQYRLLAIDVAGTVSPTSTDRFWESPDFLRDHELRGERITVDPDARMTLSLEAIPYIP